MQKILKAQIKLNAYTEGLRLAAHLDTWTEIPLEGEDLQHWDLKQRMCISERPV